MQVVELYKLNNTPETNIYVHYLYINIYYK